ncbi:MAG: hypothetical protein KDB48_01685 [Solirubrobacterales bacterium]|nr:hypothetical protein [Solirubrobacterales bacterium]HMT04577.1 hypothetical protein [Solirubrobacterales bacterium]
MNSEITKFRRFVLVMISILFFGLAANSLAQGQVRLEKSLYRLELTGIHVHDWHTQSADYPRGDRGWGTERGTITSGFHTRGNGILFRGMQYKGDLPPSMRNLPFQFYPLQGAVAKAHNRQKITIRQNLLPGCGGELGECDGTEPRGIKTTTKHCSRPNARRPFSLDYDKDTALKLKFPFDQSNYSFCGEKYPYFASITEMPQQLRVFGGIDRIAAMKRGQRETMKFSKEHGEVTPLNSTETRKVKQCPPMSGPGSQRCWVTDLTYEIRRIK